MHTLGFMSLKLEHEELYFTEIAKRANKYNIQCYRFIPTMINPITEQIEGEQFEQRSNSWQKKIFPLPDVLYDRCFYGDDFHSKQSQAIVNWLKKKEDVQFLGYGLPNKLELYQTLSQSKLAAYLPKTEKATSSQMVERLLLSMNCLIMKPINGSQGIGIYCMEKQGKGVIVRTDKREKQVSQFFSHLAQWKIWLNKLLQKKEYLIQPYLPLLNDEKQPMDVRSFLQKNSDGHWRTIGKGIRIGRKEGIISNLSAGAEVVSFEDWIASIPVRKRHYLIEEINEILASLPSILETHFSPLFELGIDIGIANDYSIWILDVNSKPGHKVILRTAPELADSLYEAPLNYIASEKRSVK